jgi:HD superfamily phosphohydrolase
LAKTFIELLILNNPEHYKTVSEEDKTSAVFTVTLAGIMHDIGHGPFSHTFDGEIVKTRIFKKGTT